MTKPNLNHPEMLDVYEVAKIIGVSPRTVWRMESAGSIPRAFRAGRIVRWRLSDIVAWIDAMMGHAHK